MNSLATKKDFIIDLPLAKVVCLLETRSDRKFYSLFAITFVTILTDVLITLIGLKCPIAIGFFFCIREMTALLVADRSLLSVCTQSTIFMK